MADVELTGAIAAVSYVSNLGLDGTITSVSSVSAELLAGTFWQTIADRHVNTPILLVTIDFDSGKRYYSNDYIRLSSQQYKGNVVNFPQISTSIGDLKRTYERNKIILILNDTDYEFRGLEESESVSFKNRIVTVELAFKENDFEHTMRLFTGFIYDWKRLDNLHFEFDVEELSYNLENQYPDKRVELSDYPDADESAIGWTIPVPYGVISALGLSGDGAFGHPSLSGESSGAGMLFVDTTQDAEIHLVGRQSAAITVDRVYLDAVLQTVGGGNDYTISTQVIDGKTHTEIHWEAGVRPTADNLVSCDITFGARTPVVAIRHFLENFCDYTFADDFDGDSYSESVAVEVSRTYVFGGALWKLQHLRTILDKWRDEFELDIFWDKEGLINFKYLATRFSTPRHYDGVHDILAGFDSDPQVDKLLNKLKYGYNYNYSKTYYYNYATYERADSQTKYGAIFEDFKGYEWVRSGTVANDLAVQRIIRLKDPITYVNINLPLKSFSENLGNMVRITHFGGTGLAGYEGKTFQIRGQQFNLDNFTCALILEDSSAFTGSSFILGDDDVLPADWDDATGTERDYGYLCDDTDGYFDNNTDLGKQLFD